MNVLVLGSGGREHAIAWKLSQSPEVKKVYVYPGNSGMFIDSKLEPLSRKVFTSQVALINEVKSKEIEFSIVGPEQYLVEGVVDSFLSNGLKIIGPTKKAANLEGSKADAKTFMLKNKIPTAGCKVFSSFEKANLYAKQLKFPAVIKADGLAAGKGVFIADSYIAAKPILEDLLLKKKIGNSGSKILIEDFIVGRELSFIVLTNGKFTLPFPCSQDYKRLLSGDNGPNTGGMGAYSPVDFIEENFVSHVIETIIDPVLRGLEAEGNPYFGFLYAGLMIEPNGELKVLEFNCRLGDPEAQVLMMKMKGDFFSLCRGLVNNDVLQAINHEDFWYPDKVTTVVAASKGYPLKPEQGNRILIDDSFFDEKDTKIFFSGVSEKEDSLVTSGGRVLSVTSMAKTMKLARASAYNGLGRISFDGMQFRKDIAL